MFIVISIIITLTDESDKRRIVNVIFLNGVGVGVCLTPFGYGWGIELQNVENH